MIQQLISSHRRTSSKREIFVIAISSQEQDNSTDTGVIVLGENDLKHLIANVIWKLNYSHQLVNQRMIQK